jgi:putative SOS response-associated peptidase YedK
MCGKADPNMTMAEYFSAAGVAMGDDGSDPNVRLKPFTPMSMVPILYLNDAKQRALTPMRWGWMNARGSANPSRGAMVLHARAETIEEKSMWQDAFMQARGVLLTRSFNIGETVAEGRAKKQWVFARPDEKEIAIAVIYSLWQHRTHGDLWTFAMVTTEPCALIREKDDRMPAILANGREIGDWLGESGKTLPQIKTLLRPYEGELKMWEQAAPERAKAAKNKTDEQPGFVLAEPRRMGDTPHHVYVSTAFKGGR